MTRVNLGQLAEAVEFVSSSIPTGNRAYVSLATGALHWESDSGDLDEELPEDLEAPGAYLEVPTRRDLGLGRPLALRFVQEQLPDEYARVRQFFDTRGAYARFKDLLDVHGQLDAWYAFEAARTEEALAGWCEANGLEPVQTNISSEDTSA